MTRTHNQKVLKDTPAPVNKKRVWSNCVLCNIKFKTEGEFRTHMTVTHKRIKRSLSEMKRCPPQRTISILKSPLEKKNKGDTHKSKHRSK